MACASGADWSVFNAPSSWRRQEVAQLYGCNDMTTGRPVLMKLAGGLLAYPVYVVQVIPFICFCIHHDTDLPSLFSPDDSLDLLLQML